MSQMLSGGYIVYEEVLYRRMQIHQSEAVGIEGVAGIVYASLDIFIATQIPRVPTPDNPEVTQESPWFGLRQIANNNLLLLFVLSHLVAIATSSYFGNSLTKAISGMARATTNCIRTIAVWIFCLLIGWERFIFFQVRLPSSLE